MTRKRREVNDDFGAAFIESITTRLAADRGVDVRLPGGRLHVDRQLPFLCVYRGPRGDDAGTAALITGQASYLNSRSSSEFPTRALRQLVRGVVRALSEPFGAFLLLELWASRSSRVMRPRLHVAGSTDRHFLSYCQRQIGRVPGLRAEESEAPVTLLKNGAATRPGTSELLTSREAATHRVLRLGLELPPVYRDPRSGHEYPEVVRSLRRDLGRGLQRMFHRFACHYTRRCPVHFHMLGKRAVDRSVGVVDRELASAAKDFDFLLLVTPTNTAAAWESFRRSGFQSTPKFTYRPVPFDPVALKRRVWDAPVERIDDPTLHEILRQKQDELDRLISLVLDIGTPRFPLGAAQVFGGVDPALLRRARAILDEPWERARDDASVGGVDAKTFARRARTEIAHYRRQWDGVEARVEIRSSLARGLMVSKGNLLIGEGTRVPTDRVEALLAHEIGTHVVTYYNGRAQRFRLLASGLAGYDPLQEGLAVFSEYLVGGLSAMRLRLLAARVVAVEQMLDGASFVDVFRDLTEAHHFEPRSAFTIAMRIFRGGGLSKDAAYLRGLIELLERLRRSHDIEDFFVGKIATEHLPVVRELRRREILSPPRLRPRYLDHEGARERWAAAIAGLDVGQLVTEG